MNVVIAAKRFFYRSVITSTRVLGKENNVYIVSTNNRFIKFQELFRSKYSKAILTAYDPNEDIEKFIKDMKKHDSLYNFDIALPLGDMFSLVYSLHKNELDFEIPLPDYNIFSIAIDKGKTMEVAIQNSIPIPRTLFEYEDISDIKNWMNEENIAYPIIVKARKRGDIWGSGTRVVKNEKQLLDVLKEFKRIGKKEPIYNYERPLIQEYINGKIYDCCVLYNNGKLRAMLTQIREKTAHPWGGAGAVNITNDIKEIKAQTKKLMDSIKWYGPAQVEWVYDTIDQNYKLIEINPRLWGTLQLSIEAGINFPELIIEMVKNGDIEEHFEYKTEIKHRWAFPHEFGNLILSKGNKIKKLIEFFNPKDVFDNKTYFSFDFDDPAPDIYGIMFETHRILIKNIKKN